MERDATAGMWHCPFQGFFVLGLRHIKKSDLGGHRTHDLKRHKCVKLALLPLSYQTNEMW